MRFFFKVTAISLLAGVVFFAVGYSYLTVSQKKPVTDNSVPSVPYYSSPENAGIMLRIASMKTVFYLDFEEESVTAIFADTISPQDNKIYGYDIDFTVSDDMELLIFLVDKFGGIDIEFEEETLNYTGVQVVELLNSNPEYRRTVTQKIIEKIAEYGLCPEDFLYIIENSETNLTLPDCYLWSKHIAKICNNVRYVN